MHINRVQNDTLEMSIDFRVNPVNGEVVIDKTDNFHEPFEQAVSNKPTQIVAPSTGLDKTKDCNFNDMITGQWQNPSNEDESWWRTMSCNMQPLTVPIFVEWLKKYELKSLMFSGQ